MTKDEIKQNAPSLATHYIDDEKGFDYFFICKYGDVYIWNSRFNVFILVGAKSANSDKYIAL